MKCVLLLFMLIGVSTSLEASKELKCEVCKVVVHQLEKEISKVNPNRKINLGHRINGQGEVEDKTKPYARSEIHLSELLDSVCKKMDDYVRAVHKATGKLEVIPIIMDSGGMNPKFTEYEAIQDSDLNKSLKFYCEGIVEEFETEIYDTLGKEVEDPESKVCYEATNLCNAMAGPKSEL